MGMGKGASHQVMFTVSADLWYGQGEDMALALTNRRHLWLHMTWCLEDLAPALVNRLLLYTLGH